MNGTVVGGNTPCFPRLISVECWKTLPRDALTIGGLEEKYPYIGKILAPYWSEYAFTGKMYEVQMKWMIRLLTTIRLYESDIPSLKQLVEEYDASLYLSIQKQNGNDTIDANAVENAIKVLLHERQLEHLQPYVNMGIRLTDVVDLAYAITWNECIDEFTTPIEKWMLDELSVFAIKYSTTAVISNGEEETITSLGNKLARFFARLEYVCRERHMISVFGDLSSDPAFSGLTEIYLQIDWGVIAGTFVQNDLKLHIEELLSFIDWNTRLCECYSHFGNVLKKLQELLMNYISDGILKGAAIGEIESEARLEVAINSFEEAGRIIDFFMDSAKCLLINLECGYSPSDIFYECPDLFGFMYQSVKLMVEGLNQIKVDHQKRIEQLEEKWYLIVEPIRTMLYTKGVETVDDILEELTGTGMQ